MLAFVSPGSCFHAQATPDNTVIGWLEVAIALGSMLFHATLRYPMQLADEIPMLWQPVCIRIFAHCRSATFQPLAPKPELNTLSPINPKSSIGDNWRYVAAVDSSCLWRLRGVDVSYLLAGWVAIVTGMILARALALNRVLGFQQAWSESGFKSERGTVCQKPG